ncbi:hypothetical protein PAPYR_5656 [Paratrimastix pyriformis]|uniref:Uncharacterized protein n=1 Tax=Paratrimastix pyriformis TaxID=342808 RepID=A0ABQ8UJS7_9EUKA|nr:hypothetical protein PAPYR_5656 [Paratrimastix pyriformis]
MASGTSPSTDVVENLLISWMNTFADDPKLRCGSFADPVVQNGSLFEAIFRRIAPTHSLHLDVGTGYGEACQALTAAMVEFYGDLSITFRSNPEWNTGTEASLIDMAKGLLCAVAVSQSDTLEEYLCGLPSNEDRKALMEAIREFMSDYLDTGPGSPNPSPARGPACTPADEDARQAAAHPEAPSASGSPFDARDPAYACQRGDCSPSVPGGERDHGSGAQALASAHPLFTPAEPQDNDTGGLGEARLHFDRPSDLTDPLSQLEALGDGTNLAGPSALMNVIGDDLLPVPRDPGATSARARSGSPVGSTRVCASPVAEGDGSAPQHLMARLQALENEHATLQQHYQALERERDQLQETIKLVGPRSPREEESGLIFGPSGQPRGRTPSGAGDCSATPARVGPVGSFPLATPAPSLASSIPGASASSVESAFSPDSPRQAALSTLEHQLAEAMAARQQMQDEADMLRAQVSETSELRVRCERMQRRLEEMGQLATRAADLEARATRAEEVAHEAQERSRRLEDAATQLQQARESASALEVERSSLRAQLAERATRLESFAVQLQTAATDNALLKSRLQTLEERIEKEKPAVISPGPPGPAGTVSEVGENPATALEVVALRERAEKAAAELAKSRAELHERREAEGLLRAELAAQREAFKRLEEGLAEKARRAAEADGRVDSLLVRIRALEQANTATASALAEREGTLAQLQRDHSGLVAAHSEAEAAQRQLAGERVDLQLRLQELTRTLEHVTALGATAAPGPVPLDLLPTEDARPGELGAREEAGPCLVHFGTQTPAPPAPPLRLAVGVQVAPPPEEGQLEDRREAELRRALEEAHGQLEAAQKHAEEATREARSLTTQLEQARDQVCWPSRGLSCGPCLSTRGLMWSLLVHRRTALRICSSAGNAQLEGTAQERLLHVKAGERHDQERAAFDEERRKWEGERATWQQERVQLASALSAAQQALTGASDQAALKHQEARAEMEALRARLAAATAQIDEARVREAQAEGLKVQSFRSLSITGPSSRSPVPSLDQAAAETETLRSSLAETRGRLEIAQEALHRAQDECESLRGQLSEWQARAATFEGARGQAEGRLGEVQNELQAVQEQLTAARADAEASMRKAEEARAEVDSVNHALLQAGQVPASRCLAVPHSPTVDYPNPVGFPTRLFPHWQEASRVAELEKRLADVPRQLERSASLEEAREQLGAAQAKVAALEEDLRRRRQEEASVQKQLDDRQRSVEEAQLQRATLQKSLDTALQAAEEARRNAASLQARLDTQISEEKARRAADEGRSKAGLSHFGCPAFSHLPFSDGCCLSPLSVETLQNQLAEKEKLIASGHKEHDTLMLQHKLLVSAFHRQVRDSFKIRCGLRMPPAVAAERLRLRDELSSTHSSAIQTPLTLQTMTLTTNLSDLPPPPFPASGGSDPFDLGATRSAASNVGSMNAPASRPTTAAAALSRPAPASASRGLNKPPLAATQTPGSRPTIPRIVLPPSATPGARRGSFSGASGVAGTIELDREPATAGHKPEPWVGKCPFKLVSKRAV